MCKNDELLMIDGLYFLCVDGDLFCVVDSSWVLGFCFCEFRFTDY